MELLNQINLVTNHIEQIYQDIIQLEWSTDLKKKQEKIEDLKLYKLLEEKYYKELNKKNLNFVKENFNYDYSLIFGLEFPMQDFNFLFENGVIKDSFPFVERRISHNVSDLMVQKLKNEEFLIWLYQSNIIDIYHHDYVFSTDYKFFRIYDRVEEVKKILKQVYTSIYIYYLRFIDEKINEKNLFSPLLIRYKYLLCFISRELENYFLPMDFNITDLTIDKLENSVELVQYLLKRFGNLILSSLIDSIRYYKDSMLCGENQFYYYYLLTLDECFYKACIHFSGSNQLEKIIYELENLDQPYNQNIRQYLVKTFKNFRS